MIEITKVMKIM